MQEVTEMKKPQWILIGITAVFACVLLGVFLGRNMTRNYISIRNTTPSETAVATERDQTDDGRIDINTATEQQLTLLPGIGETMAKRIIEYRTENGKFTTIEDLMKVNGIGEKKFLQMKPYIKVGQ